MITCFLHAFIFSLVFNTCFVYSYVYFFLTLFLIKLKFSICSPASTLLLRFQMHDNSVSFFLKAWSHLMSSNCSGCLFYPGAQLHLGIALHLSGHSLYFFVESSVSWIPCPPRPPLVYTLLGKHIFF